MWLGLYLDPPAHSLVLSVDEKSQIQALDRTQPGLPMKKDRARDDDPSLHPEWPTTLFAALNVLDGTIIGQCMARHRHQEFIRFLNRIEAAARPANWSMRSSTITPPTNIPKCTPGSRGIPGGCSTSPPPRAPGPMPSRSSSPTLTRRRLQRGVFHSLVDLQAAINRYLGEHNRKPKPFVWTADPDRIIEKVQSWAPSDRVRPLASVAGTQTSIQTPC